MLSTVLGPGLVIFPGSPLHHRRLQAAPTDLPIAFALERSPLDSRAFSNWGIRV
jgi:hypothetical protein